MQRKIKYGVIGYAGRMGKEIISVMEEGGNEFVFGVEKDEVIEKDKPEVIFDFSSPEALESSIELSKKFSSKLIVGTTGLKEEHFQNLKSNSEYIAILYSANFSVGVYALKEILKKANSILKDWDCELVEIHHNKKKDAPSGTAKSLMEIIGKDIKWHSLRIGGVVGEHSVYFSSPGDLIEIKHSAISRRTFAEGAKLAAGFLLSKQNGFYTFDDIFKEN